MPNKTILKWAGIVTILLVGSRILGFLRETAIAYQFGASAETDAYLIAVMLPQILFFAFNDALKTAFIPIYGEYHREEDGNAFAYTIYVLLSAILLLFSIVLVITAPVIVKLIAPGFHGETFQITVTMSRILLPGLFFMGLSGLSSGILHTKKNFVVPAVPAYPSNLIIVFAAIFLGGRYGIIGLAWATIVAFASQFLIQLPAVIKHGVFRSRKLLWGHPGIKKMAVLLPPVILGGAAIELKSIIDRTFGSLLPDGSIAALNFATRIYLLPNGILILALLTVLYPTLVELQLENRIKEFKDAMRQSIGLIIVLVFPMMVGLIVLRVPVVSLLFERGAFDAAATDSTAYALAFYSLGLIPLGMMLLISRAFYAVRDTVTPMGVTIFTMLLNILLNWLLMKPLGHGGIALGTALSVYAGAAALSYLLWKRIGAFGGRRLVQTLLKSGIASLGMGVLLLYGRQLLTGGGFARQALELGGLIGFGAGIYFLLAYLLRVEELSLALAIIRSKMARR
ncbi:MAG: murein biosynthesis integral membrane protein MurJ [Bacillota bacterium]|nr:murein biosynthesis integral membrane protein MurJ [Bacillota bacterium]MDW7684655.1 murein biosynthesis integral membrane protein MurJ [Bacillota bacterium]